jgi:hypothetical protein
LHQGPARSMQRQQSRNQRRFPTGCPRQWRRATRGFPAGIWQRLPSAGEALQRLVPWDRPIDAPSFSTVGNGRITRLQAGSSAC